MGGSLIKHGGQNPIEPTRKGCKIYHGPNINNFKEVYSYLNSHNISKKINNISDLKKFLLKDLNSKESKRKKLKEQINVMGQSILKKIYLKINKFIINYKWKFLSQNFGTKENLQFGHIFSFPFL